MAENKEDLQKLIGAIDSVREGELRWVDPEEFTDQRIPMSFNQMMSAMVRRSNHFLMRINDAMIRIGDLSKMKALLEQVEAQQKPIAELRDSRDRLRGSIELIEQLTIQVLGSNKKVRAYVEPCTDEMDEAMKMVAALEEEGKADPVLLEKLRASMERTKSVVTSMDNSLRNAIEGGENVYQEIMNQQQASGGFMKNVEFLADSYGQLSMECLDTGTLLFAISRDVDNARNDMYRKNSLPTEHDRLKVFSVDHLVLTWRLYNHIAELEVLRIQQLNNPTGCKFGLWARNTAPKELQGTEYLEKAVKAHDRLHELAVDCLNAKNESNDALAIDYFYQALEAYAAFNASLDDIHDYLRKCDIVEETPVWKYEGL